MLYQTGKDAFYNKLVQGFNFSIKKQHLKLSCEVKLSFHPCLQSSLSQTLGSTDLLSTCNFCLILKIISQVNYIF